MTVPSVSKACYRSKGIRIGGSRSKNGCSTCRFVIPLRALHILAYRRDADFATLQGYEE